MDISLSMGNSQLAASWLVPGCLKTPSRWDTTTKYHWKYTLKSNILIYDYFFAYTASNPWKGIWQLSLRVTSSKYHLEISFQMISRIFFPSSNFNSQ
jgi:hypothetical protein